MTLEEGILITKLTCADNLSLMEVLRVTSINDNLLAPDTIILFCKVELINNITLKEDSITWIVNLYLTHHLTYDNLEVLIVNLHTLQTINVLYFVNDILLNSRKTSNLQNIIQSDYTCRQWSTCTYSIMLLNEQLLRQWYKILTLFTRLRGDCYLTITTLQWTHCYLTIDFRYDSRITWVTCLKELGNTWQTTSDITSTTNSTWNLNNCFTC